MTRRNSPPNRDGEGGGGNLLWYLAIFGLAALFLAVYLVNATGEQIAYTDLLRLIEKSERKSQGGELVTPDHAHIIISQGKTKVKYSNLRDVQIGPDRIVGKVDALVVEPPSADNKMKRGRKFRTNKNETEDADTVIRQKLEESNISYDFLPPPSAWEKYGPVLLLTALLILVFFLMMPSPRWDRFGDGVWT